MVAKVYEDTQAATSQFELTAALSYAVAAKHIPPLDDWGCLSRLSASNPSPQWWERLETAVFPGEGE